MLNRREGGERKGEEEEEEEEEDRAENGCRGRDARGLRLVHRYRYGTYIHTDVGLLC